MRYLLLSFLLTSSLCFSQNKTDVSLFLRSDSTKYLEEISSEDGDMFITLGHHGPAIENEYFGLRIYFDNKCAIDVYSKARQGLELKETLWYSTEEQQKEGWGADYYKAGLTIGLGGVRLWDGEKVVFLNPVNQRTARVVNEANSSYMEVLSEAVPYKDREVDILIRITVFSTQREAKIEAFALADEPVQFVTGINYHIGNKVKENGSSIAVWGLHPEDVAKETVELGGAIIYNPNDFIETIDLDNQKLLISNPTKQIKTWITSACQRENKLNNINSFFDYVRTIRP